MATEPSLKRTIAFFDGQNLFNAAKRAFGYHFPNFDPIRLAQMVCQGQGWDLVETRFYTGVPDPQEDPDRAYFWNYKLRVLNTRGSVHVYTGKVRYRVEEYDLDGETIEVTVGQEKGVDVRIALDMVRLARQQLYDVALIFSQDQDLAEAAREVVEIARSQERWVKLASAFPYSSQSKNKRGVNGSDWIKISRYDYDGCIDQMDYRRKK